MPIPGRTPYVYKPEDDPIGVANQFGITPQQLLGANPGGAPFVTGQTINIPTQYNYQGSTPTAQPVQQPGPSGVPSSPYAVDPARGRGYTPPSLLSQWMNKEPDYGYNTDQRGRGFSTTSVDQINAMRSRGYGGTGPTGPMVIGNWVDPAQPAFDPTKPYGGFERAGADNKDYVNTATARYYEAAGTPFLQQQRWDPQRRRFVSIGRLLRQGKLDLKGNWHRRGNRQRVNDALARRRDQKQQQQQDFTLANSLINFSVSSG